MTDRCSWCRQPLESNDDTHCEYCNITWDDHVTDSLREVQQTGDTTETTAEVKATNGGCPALD